MKVNLKIQSLKKVIKYVFFAGILFSVVATACSHDKKKSKTKTIYSYFHFNYYLSLKNSRSVLEIRKKLSKY